MAIQEYVVGHVRNIEATRKSNRAIGGASPEVQPTDGVASKRRCRPWRTMRQVPVTIPAGGW